MSDDEIASRRNLARFLRDDEDAPERVSVSGEQVVACKRCGEPTWFRWSWDSASPQPRVLQVVPQSNERK